MSHSLPNVEPAQQTPEKGVIKPIDHSNDYDEDEDALLLTHALIMVATKQSCAIIFEDVYRAAYRLTVEGRGLRLYAILECRLGRMALCHSARVYGIATSMINSLCLYFGRTWMPYAHRRGAIPHGEIGTLAKELYDRPVARRWRRIAKVHRAVASTSRSLMLYNEAMFTPGAPGAEQCAKRFMAHAAGMGLG